MRLENLSGIARHPEMFIAKDDYADIDFCRRLPKVELHAHLSGSISPHTLHDIWLQRKAEEPSLDLEDPLVMMSTEKEHFNIKTSVIH